MKKLMILFYLFGIVSCKNVSLGKKYFNQNYEYLSFTSDTTFEYIFHFDQLLLKSSGMVERNNRQLVLNSYRDINKIPIKAEVGFDSSRIKDYFIIKVKNKNEINANLCFYTILINGIEEIKIGKTLPKTVLYPKVKLKLFSINIYPSAECVCYNKVIKTDKYSIYDTINNVLELEIDLRMDDFNYSTFKDERYLIKKNTLIGKNGGVLRLVE